MSNLSNIGFTATTQEEFGALIQATYKFGVAFKIKEGAYHRYSDNSGAEFWIQFNSKNQCIGAQDMSIYDNEKSGIVQGLFWLSGRLIDPPQREGGESKGFLKKLFGK